MAKQPPRPPAPTQPKDDYSYYTDEEPMEKPPAAATARPKEPEPKVSPAVTPPTSPAMEPEPPPIKGMNIEETAEPLPSAARSQEILGPLPDPAYSGGGGDQQALAMCEFFGQKWGAIMLGILKGAGDLNAECVTIVEKTLLATPQHLDSGEDGVSGDARGPPLADDQQQRVSSPRPCKLSMTSVVTPPRVGRSTCEASQEDEEAAPGKRCSFRAEVYAAEPYEGQPHGRPPEALFIGDERDEHEHVKDHEKALHCRPPGDASCPAVARMRAEWDKELLAEPGLDDKQQQVSWDQDATKKSWATFTLDDEETTPKQIAVPDSLLERTEQLLAEIDKEMNGARKRKDAAALAALAALKESARQTTSNFVAASSGAK